MEKKRVVYFDDIMDLLINYGLPVSVIDSVEKKSIPANKITDGYNTIDDLYYERAILFGSFLAVYGGWKSWVRNDDTKIDNHFCAGTFLPSGRMVFFVIPEILWDVFPGKIVDKSPKFDRFRKNNVTDSLKQFWKMHGNVDNAFHPSNK